MDKPYPKPKIEPTTLASFITSLCHLLAKFGDIFATPSTPPPPRSFDHRISLLPNTPPVNVKSYLYPYLSVWLARWLQRRLYNLASAFILPPVLLVKKHDGTWWLSVEYRALNAVTVKDRFPIPIIKELFDEIICLQVFSKLDFWAEYHQVWIHSTDIEKITLQTHEVIMSSGWCLSAYQTHPRLSKLSWILSSKLLYITLFLSSSKYLDIHPRLGLPSWVPATYLFPSAL